MTRPGQPSSESPPEVHRVEELVVDPAVDDVDRLGRRVVVRIRTRPPTQTRSRPSTSSTPIMRASRACSK